MSILPTKKRYLENLVDKHFQNMFFPLNSVLSMLILPHFNFRDGFITPNNRFQKFKTLLVGIGLFVVWYFRFKTAILFKEMKSFDTFIIASVYFDWVYYSFALICLFASNIINSENYVSLVLNLQKAFRNFSSVNKTVKSFIFWNWVSMIVVPAYLIVAFLAFGDYGVAGFLNIFPHVYFDVVVVYTCSVIRLIESELELWLHEMQSCNRRFVELQWNENEKESKMFQTYRYILNAYHLFKKVCKVPILFELAEIITHVLIYLQVNIDDRVQRPEVTLGTFLLNHKRIVVMIWALKNCLFLFIICNSCEKFYSHVTTAEQICQEEFVYRVTTDEFRRACKNVCRYNRARFSRLRVCGATVDARLPLRVALIVTSYTAVILQFNFL